MNELLVQTHDNGFRYVDLTDDEKLKVLSDELDNGLSSIPSGQFDRSPFYFTNRTEKLLLRRDYKSLRETLAEFQEVDLE